MSASNNGLTSDAARLTPRATLLAGMALQWEEHKRKAQDAAHTAQFHEREADRLEAEMRALKQPTRSPHGDATHTGKPQWMGGK